MNNPYKDIAPEDILRMQQEAEMDKVEDVKKILDTHALCVENGEYGTDELAQQICQLFESKPDFITDEKDRLARAQYAYETGHPERELELKPSRLLTDEETKGAISRDVAKSKHSKYRVPISVHPRDKIIREAQDAKSYKVGFDEGYAKAREELNNGRQE